MKFYKKIILSIIFNSLLFWYLSENFSSLVEPHFHGKFHIDATWISFVILAALFGFLNSFVKPLLKLITLPIRFLTVGLFGFVINAFVLLLLEKIAEFLELDAKFVIIGWGTYFIVGLILSVANGIIHWFED
jgi:uncharacterized membrane protein YvlD (DUF360 family)